MGRDKAAIEVGGRSLLRLQLDRLAAVGATDLVVSSAACAPRPDAVPGHPAVRWVEDALPDQGPLAGMAAALRAARAPWAWVVAVDLPELDAEFLSALRVRSRPGCGVVPRREGRWEPLCAFYPREEALRELEKMAAEGNRAARELVGRGVAGGWLEGWDVPADLGPRLTNWNRPADWTAG